MRKIMVVGEAYSELREILLSALAAPSNGGFGRMLVGAAGALNVFDNTARTLNKLYRLIEHNDVRGVKRLIAKDFDVNARDAEGRTPLDIAATHDCDENCWLLVEADAGRVH